MEQEVIKKEKQRQMLLSKRVNLKNVVRLVSQESFISPSDEIKEARRIYDIMKARKRLGRKRKNPLPEEMRPPGSIDLELPLVKEEMEAKKISYERELEASQQAETTVEPSEKSDSLSDKTSEMGIDSSQTPTVDEKNNYESQIQLAENDIPPTNNPSGMPISTEENLDKEKSKGTVGTDNRSATTPRNENTEHIKEETSRDPVIKPASNETEDKNEEGLDRAANDDLAESTNEKNTEHKQEEIATEEHHLESASSLSPTGAEHGPKESPRPENHEENDRPTTNDDGEFTSVDQKELNSKDDNVNSATVEDERSSGKLEDNSNVDDPEKKAMRKVKFVDELLDTPEQTESSRTTPAIEETGQVYEGPSQRVARNAIYFIDFQSQDGKEPDLSTDKIKEMLLGEQSLWPASRRFKDLKAYIRIGNKENPYANNKQEKDELFEPAAELGEDDAIFEPLKKLPRFGVFDEEYEEEEKNVEEENAPIVIKTEAPTGLYLPNGNKKICLISGTEVKYFDPSTGIPYSNVETYRFLKTIEQGNIPWLCIPEEANDNGAVELYLGSRDGSVKPAAGVPEGFDALT
ncbi:Piso0_002486 [Millerozyma farinosa CBS 7064]|uniref:Piso0_002486 protein n=1 Tax=Pichia sorbitophila (strain ATCC MYA-4447 / BCRC 22081 / CBS 7064 / NBRC 10061 / NRRL Y-12695) TaxID=559304 RepID=G8YCR2_PICSO|nr:Piso0_002486 [Millerozyma farinosa CBS 7064]